MDKKGFAAGRCYGSETILKPELKIKAGGLNGWQLVLN